MAYEKINVSNLKITTENNDLESEESIEKIDISNLKITTENNDLESEESTEKIDLSNLKITTENNDLESEESNEKKESKENLAGEISTEKPERKIRSVAQPDLPILYDLRETVLPLNIHFSDGSIDKMVWFQFDTYFKFVNRGLWNRPDYAKDADLITMKDKMEDAAPYNVFFNTLKYCPETKEQLYSISFTDLLCPSFGKLKCSFHITFMADIKWILGQYALRKLHKLPMTIIHGYLGFPWPEKQTMEKLYPDIDHHYIEVKKKETDIGCHHTKLSFFVYEDDSFRVVIGSANLFFEDWEIFNQQLWISPPCPKLPEGSSVMDGESPTGFKFALLDYLFTYQEFGIPTLQEWIDRVKNADFSQVKVALIFCVPGVHQPRKNGSLLHFLGHLLSRDCTIPAPKKEHDSWPVVAQTSALGLVGRNPDEWLTTHLLKAFGSHKESPYLPTLPSTSKIPFNLIFPTVENARNSYLGYIGAACCPYDSKVKELQPWLLRKKRQWKADGTKRTRAISHSKCYFRVSPCWQKMPYYFLTSSNLSRSGWGKIPDRDGMIFVRSYEMGVLFLPKYFEEEYFEIKDVPNRKNKKLFPMMFDIPLIPYGPNDDSFCGSELVEKGLITISKVEESDASEDDSSEDDASKHKPTGSKKESPSTSSKNDNIDIKSKSLEVEATKNTEENEDDNSKEPSPSSAKKDNKAEVTKNKWDEVSQTKNSENVETKKKDMKYNAKPKANMFFPAFGNKKS